MPYSYGVFVDKADWIEQNDFQGISFALCKSTLPSEDRRHACVGRNKKKKKKNALKRQPYNNRVTACTSLIVRTSFTQTNKLWVTWSAI